MKKYLNKKTYGFIALFFFLCYFAYTKKSYIIDELFATNEAMKTTQVDIKIAEKKLATAKTTIENIKRENAKNIKDKIDINVIKTKIKRQIKAYNLLNQTIKINLNDIKEQSKYLDAFVAEFELVNAGADTKQIATTLDFLGLYGVVESYKNNKVVVYISLKNEHQNIPTTPKNEVIIDSQTASKKDKIIPLKEEKNTQPKVKVEPKKVLRQTTTPQTQKLIQKEKVKAIKKDTIKIKTTQNSQSFDTAFLSANKEKFTINLFTSVSDKQSFDLLQSFKLQNNAITFSFGEVETLYKTMYGIYDTKEEAQKAIETLPSKIQFYNPRVEKIAIKQALYKKYHQNKNTLSTNNTESNTTTNGETK